MKPTSLKSSRQKQKQNHKLHTHPHPAALDLGSGSTIPSNLALIKGIIINYSRHYLPSPSPLIYPGTNLNTITSERNELSTESAGGARGPISLFTKKTSMLLKAPRTLQARQRVIIYNRLSHSPDQAHHRNLTGPTLTPNHYTTLHDNQNRSLYAEADIIIHFPVEAKILLINHRRVIKK